MDRIVLGSGKLFSTVATKGTDGHYVIPADADIEKDENRLGWISGGASIEYGQDSYTAKDDLSMVAKTIITSEDATFKSGILTFDGNTLKKLSASGSVSEDPTTHIRTVKIGGLGNSNNEVYILRFVHDAGTDGKIRITVCGKNTAGWSLQFQKDSETVLNAEFACEPIDGDGTLIMYTEEDASIQ